MRALLGARSVSVAVLAVFDDDAEIAASGLQEAIDDELIGFGEGRERARLRADVAKLDFGAARDGRGGNTDSRERDASGCITTCAPYLALLACKTSKSAFAAARSAP